MSADGFFAVGRSTFIKACSLGINPACALLVMACGTGKDNVTTKWSAEAVGNYASIRWTTARNAIEVLRENGLVVKTGTVARPAYKLKKEGKLIWLPRTLVEGAADEQPPIARVRQSQDPMMLRLLIELYAAQNLREDGGISATLIRSKYERRKIGQQGAYTVWDFVPVHRLVYWNETTTPHMIELTEEQREKGKTKADDFFSRFSTLTTLGLIQWVPYLFEGEEGEPLHPMLWDGLPAEVELYFSATAAARRMLTEGQCECIQGTPVPVKNHIGAASMIGVARLRYRPHTRLTAAWWADHVDTCKSFAEVYSELAMENQPVRRTGTA